MHAHKSSEQVLLPHWMWKLCELIKLNPIEDFLFEEEIEGIIRFPICWQKSGAGSVKTICCI